MKQLRTLTKFDQIQTIIKDRMEMGTYKPGDKIPGERTLSKEYAVSHVTVNKAIAGLVSKGLLERRHGIGSFVATPKHDIVYRNTIGYISISAETDSDALFPHLIQQKSNFDHYISSFFDIDSLNVACDNLKNFLRKKPFALLIDAPENFPFNVIDEVSEETKIIFYHRFEKKQKYKKASYILTDYFDCGYQAASEMIKRNKKDIAVITFPQTSPLSAATQFMNGIKSALEKVGVHELRQIYSPRENEDFSGSLRRIMKSDGIIAFGDFRIIPFLRKVQVTTEEFYRKIPVIGVYDTSWAHAYEMSSLSINTEGILQEVFKALQQNETIDIKIKPQMIYRKSCSL